MWLLNPGPLNHCPRLCVVTHIYTQNEATGAGRLLGFLGPVIRTSAMVVLVREKAFTHYRLAL